MEETTGSPAFWKQFVETPHVSLSLKLSLPNGTDVLEYFDECNQTIFFY